MLDLVDIFILTKSNTTLYAIQQKSDHEKNLDLKIAEIQMKNKIAKERQAVRH